MPMKNKEMGFCYTELIFSIGISCMVLSAITMAVCNSMQQSFEVSQRLEIMQMNRFARQIITRKLKYIQEKPLIYNSGEGMHGFRPKPWGFIRRNYAINKTLSDGQAQPITGQMYRDARYEYVIEPLETKTIYKDLNGVIHINWIGYGIKKQWEHKIKTAVLPYYYYFNQGNDI